MTCPGGNRCQLISILNRVLPFFKREGKYLVRIDGPDGQLQEYEIAYTFGVEPLQQYLIAFPGGRYQVLSLCWDTRPAREGGQRWFHLYPREQITHEHPLHWTGISQNWNHMCAECHSTNWKKNYLQEEDRFQTSSHHFHPLDSWGASCVECYRPARQYMVVDPRRDHSFRIPRPDLSLEISTPNACTACHTDRPRQWAADSLTQWYGPERSSPECA